MPNIYIILYYIILYYIYIFAVYTVYYIYVHLQSCTYISDVSKRGVLGSADDDIACFLHILSILVVIYFFADHEHVFVANTCIFYTVITRYCICSAYYDIVYCSWKDLAAIYMHIFCIFSVPYAWKTQNGRKMRQTFWSFRGFRL